jgi:hypothetical protein
MKATILVVDHDEQSLEVLQRDMARGYGADYDVLAASSAPEAASPRLHNGIENIRPRHPPR